MAKWNNHTVSAAFAKIASAGDGPTSKTARANLEATLALIDEPHAVELFGKGVELDRLKFTTWQPDTCSCQIVYVWHLDDAAEHRAHHAISREACEHHNHLTDARTHYAAVLAENQGKNKAVGELAEKLGVEPHEISFTFGEGRALVLDHPKLREG